MNSKQIEIRGANPRDWNGIQRLLDRARLPGSDLAADKLEGFFVATLQDDVVGVAGLELAHPFGLLRSVAVEPAQRNNGWGTLLVEHCLGFARERSLKALYLIPNDELAAAFFMRLDFTLIERRRVPQPLRGLAEFTHLCPQSYPCLRKVLDADFAEEHLLTPESAAPSPCCARSSCCG